MGFLKRFALNIAMIIPLLGIAGCISYVISKHFGGSSISLEPSPNTRSLQTTAKAPAIVDAERGRHPNEIAAEAFGRALLLRDAMAGPVPIANPVVPLPKPRPRNLPRPSNLQ